MAINSTRNPAEHDERRRVWDRSFSTQALRSYEQRVDKYAVLLDRRIEELSIKEASVNVSEWFHWFSFDVMGDLTFAKSFRMLENGEAHPLTEMLRKSLAMIGLLSPAPWMLRLGIDIFPYHPVVRQWMEWIKYAKALARECEKMSADRCDISSRLIEASTKNSIPEADQWHWIDGDSTAATIAGSDTVAATLVFVFYFLATLPQEQTKLREELRGIDVFDRKSLQLLPHLNGVINETLRLRPPVPTHGSRDTPPEGMMIAGRYIPGGTTLYAPRWTIGRLPRYFPRPNDFVAERWYSQPELIRDKRGYQPFCLGRYSCAGKQLALSELRVVIALLASRYEVRLAPDDDGTKVLGEMTDRFTVLPGPLKLAFTRSPVEP
ncbi:hypothetical protein MMC17_008639 [Xylographa soralifera]|nr:hypothetical protein [Xylographa soralifera]